jgi:hypothetical protein
MVTACINKYRLGPRLHHPTIETPQLLLSPENLPVTSFLSPSPLRAWQFVRLFCFGLVGRQKSGDKNQSPANFLARIAPLSDNKILWQNLDFLAWD